MKWFTYMRRTPWTQIYADIKEYKNLWRQYFVLRANRSVAYNELIDVVNGDGNNQKKEPACIRQTYYFTSLEHKFSSDSDNSFVLVRNSTCRKFNKNGDYLKCTESDCPYVQRNHNYADMCRRLDMARRLRRDFWRAKFANIK